MFEFTNTEMLTICAILGGWAAMFVARGFKQAIAGSALMGIFSTGFVIYDTVFSAAGPTLEGGLVVVALSILPATLFIYMGRMVLRALPSQAKAESFNSEAIA